MQTSDPQGKRTGIPSPVISNRVIPTSAAACTVATPTAKAARKAAGEKATLQTPGTSCERLAEEYERWDGMS